MKKDIVLMDRERGVYQITTTDERWYTIPSFDKETNLPIYKFVPSVTWITSYVYKGIEFYKWLANKGWDESEAIKTEAGERGSRVHKGCELLQAGETVNMETKIANGDGIEKDLSPEEYGAIVSFKNWFTKTDPEIILNETTLISENHNFAGTVDFICRIKGQLYIVDFKTSQYIWPSMEAQLSAYKYALLEMIAQGQIVGITLEEAVNVKLAILQLGYKKNKNQYKFTEVEDKFEDLFIPAQKFWSNANSKVSPKQYELPMSVSLNIKNKQSDEQTIEGAGEDNTRGISSDEERRRTPSDAAVREILLPTESDSSTENVGSDEVLQPGRHSEVEEEIQRSEVRSELPKRKVSSYRREYYQKKKAARAGDAS